MKLQKGITGFRKANGDQDYAQIDENELKKHAYHCGNLTEFRLEEILCPDASSNYFRLIYKHKITKQRIDIVINNQYPFYAGISSDSKWMQLQFVDLPQEIRMCLDEKFTYLNPKLLTTEFSDEDLTELSATEVDQIEYWDSKTYGEVIFNGYD